MILLLELLLASGAGERHTTPKRSTAVFGDPMAPRAAPDRRSHHWATRLALDVFYLSICLSVYLSFYISLSIYLYIYIYT